MRSSLDAGGAAPFPNPVVGESILDRVINTSHHLLLEGKSYRPRRRPGRTAPATRNPP
jgi:hypothetical protein